MHTKKIKKINGLAWKKDGFATRIVPENPIKRITQYLNCLLYTSDAADE